jgi:hypothetical protein
MPLWLFCQLFITNYNMVVLLWPDLPDPAVWARAAGRELVYDYEGRPQEAAHLYELALAWNTEIFPNPSGILAPS